MAARHELRAEAGAFSCPPRLTEYETVDFTGAALNRSWTACPRLWRWVDYCRGHSLVARAQSARPDSAPSAAAALAGATGAAMAADAPGAAIPRRAAGSQLRQGQHAHRRPDRHHVGRSGI